jgi:hypothetical protein
MSYDYDTPNPLYVFRFVALTKMLNVLIFRVYRVNARNKMLLITS